MSENISYCQNKALRPQAVGQVPIALGESLMQPEGPIARKMLSKGFGK